MHEPSSDTVKRTVSALSKRTSVHVPLAVVGVGLLALCGWIYNHVDAAESGVAQATYDNIVQEKSIERNQQKIQRITDKLDAINVQQAAFGSKQDAMAEDIREIKQAVKSH